MDLFNSLTVFLTAFKNAGGRMDLDAIHADPTLLPKAMKKIEAICDAAGTILPAGLRTVLPTVFAPSFVTSPSDADDKLLNVRLGAMFTCYSVSTGSML